MENRENGERLYNLYVLLRRCADTTSKARTRELHRFGITPRRFAAMNAIKQFGGKATAAQLSRWLYLERHTVSEMINRMERDGLAQRLRDNQGRDLRLTQISLTEKGKRVYEIVQRKQAVIQRIMSSLSRRDADQLAEYLKLLDAKAREEITNNHKASQRW